jgi:hypothetical protein
MELQVYPLPMWMDKLPGEKNIPAGLGRLVASNEPLALVDDDTFYDLITAPGPPPRPHPDTKRDSETRDMSTSVHMFSNNARTLPSFSEGSTELLIPTPPPPPSGTKQPPPPDHSPTDSQLSLLSQGRKDLKVAKARAGWTSVPALRTKAMSKQSMTETPSAKELGSVQSQHAQRKKKNPQSGKFD